MMRNRREWRNWRAHPMTCDHEAQIRDLLEEREELLTEIRRLRDDGFPLELDEHFREIAARRPTGTFPKEKS